MEEELDPTAFWQPEENVSEAQIEVYKRLQEKAIGDIQTFSTPSARGRKKTTPVTVTVTTTNAPNNGAGSPITTVPMDEHHARVFGAYIKRKFNNDYYSSDEEDDYSSDGGGLVSFTTSDDEEDEGERDDNRKRKRSKKPHSCEEHSSDDDNNRDGRRRKRRREGEYDYSMKHECFLCAWGNKFHDGIEAPQMIELWNIFHQNYGSHHNKEIAQEMHLYFKKYIYDPRAGMRMLTREIILEHIEGLHSMNARVFLCEAMREEKELMFLFKNAIWRSDGTYDKNAVIEYRKSKQTLLSLYRADVNKWNFNTECSMDDMKRMASLHKMKAKFDQVKRKKRPLLITPQSTHRRYL